MPQQIIDITTAEGVIDTTIAWPDGDGPWPVVILLMDGLGVRPTLRAMAERLAAAGYYVLLPNLYHRGGRADDLDLINDPSRMAELFQSVSAPTVAAECAALLDFAVHQPQARADRVGCVGYCMGGGLALGVAGRLSERIAAAACIHGAQLATDLPTSPHRLAAQLRARTYIAVAETDPWLQPGETERLRQALADGGAQAEFEFYPGVAHGFAVADLAAYDAAAAERHWQRVLALFAQTLR